MRYVYKAINKNECHLKDYFVNGHHQRHWVRNDTGEFVADDYEIYKFSKAELQKIAELRPKAKRVLLPLVNIVFENEKLPSEKARFSKSSIGKLLSDNAIRKSVVNGFSVSAHIAAAQKIKELFEKSDFVGAFPDDNGNKNVVAMRRFSTEIKIKNKESIAYITVKEAKKEGRRIYTLELILKKRRPKSP